MTAAKNRFNATTLGAIEAALDEVGQKEGTAVLVLAGEGKFFSIGLDLDWMAAARAVAAQDVLQRMQARSRVCSAFRWRASRRLTVTPSQHPIVHMVRLYRPDAHNVDLCRRGLIQSGAKIVAPGEPIVQAPLAGGAARQSPADAGAPEGPQRATTFVQALIAEIARNDGDRR